MLKINRNICIPDAHLSESFVRSPGPGGQHVNKTSSAVQLRFHVDLADYLSDVVKKRLRRLAGRCMHADGALVIEAKRYRSQERNREDARQRLAVLLRQALQEPEKRTPTRPTRASVERRLGSKKVRSGVKQLRKKPTDLE